MRLSAKTALIEARPHIDAARQARSTKDIIKQYQDAKKVLTKVDAKKEDVHSLKEMIDAFHELADILDMAGLDTQDKAEKCKKRATALEQELNRITTTAAAVALSLLGGPQMALVSLPKYNTTTVTVPNNSAATPATTSTGNVVSPATLSPKHNPRSTPQAPVSLSAAIGSAKIPLLFGQKADRESFVCHLPAPGEQLKSTRQLAYCLALLQDSFDKTCLDLDTLKWRSNILKNSDEMIRMEDITRQVVREFIKGGEKNATVVEEVVQLAQVLHKEASQSLLRSFVDTVNNSTLLHSHAMDGLARVIQGATPGSIDSDDLVTILGVLYKRLQTIHYLSTSHLYPLLLAVSRVLDAMVVAQVGEVDRITLHGPLTALLHELESNLNPCVAFQAEYATQALLNISDDDNIWRAGFRRGWLVLKGAAGFAKMPDPREIKDALEGLEKLYEAGKGAVRMLNDSWMAVKTGEKIAFTTKEGFKFKRIWYPTLCTAEEYIQTGDLGGFKELLTNAPCRHQPMFQLGICQLLGQFVVDARWDLESRRSTLAFLGDLCQADDVWERQKGVVQVIFDIISHVAVHHGSQFEAAKVLQETIQQQNLALTPLTEPQSHPWNGFLSVNPTAHATLTSTLLMAVQNKKQHEDGVAAIQSSVEQIADELLPSQSSLKDIQSALKTHYAPNLFIRRISGDELDLGTCFVNLAIVESPAQREKEKQNLKEQAALFHRIPSSETVPGSNTQSSIPLEQLFDKRKLRDGKENVPKRILVQGRAGIGKTTLCKKLVHAHQNGLWEDRFDAVLWLPLRQLRSCTSRTLQSLLREKFFDTQQFDREQEELTRTLTARAKEGKVLFILDGLDEIATDTQNGDDPLMPLLMILLKQRHVIITTRPAGLNRLLLPQIDLELETIGFSQQNIKDFVVKVLDLEPARTVQDFIQRAPLIQGLVNIPVQLDVICFCWSSLPEDTSQVTMTRLYQLMVRKLWCKDALRLKKTRAGRVLTEEQISKLTPKLIDQTMATELQHLGYLAFKGMKNNHQIEFDEAALLGAFEDLTDDGHTDDSRPFPSQVLDFVKETSFLHTADVDLDMKNSGSRQAWHFLHLTFQEYFAATWIVRHFHLKQPYFSPGMMTMEEMAAFVHQHKYNPQYEIVWTMAAGLLEGEPLRNLFGIFQGEPRDMIGGRHQKVLASCLNEARTRLDSTVVADLDTELREWLYFEMQTLEDDYTVSMLGSQLSFPEAILIDTWCSAPWWKCSLVKTLETRSILSDSALQLLASSLQDEDRFVSSSSASALGNHSVLPEIAIKSLIIALKDDDKHIRNSESALRKQSTISESAIQSLIAALKDENKIFRSSAASVLGSRSTLPESVIQYVTAGLKDGNRRVRSSAVSILHHPTTLPESLMLSLIAALEDDDQEVKTSAALALCNKTKFPEAAIQSFNAALKDADPKVKSSVVLALCRRSSLSESVIRLLNDIHHDEHASVRETALYAFKIRSSLPEATIQPLVDMLKDGNKSVRDSAAHILGKQATLPESVVQYLATALMGDDESIRYSAAYILGRKATLPESVIQPLIVALENEDSDTRSSAAWALNSQLSLPESATHFLLVALKDEDKVVRYYAALALGKQSSLPEPAIPALIAALGDEDYMVRKSASKALDKQSIFPESVDQYLVGALNDGNMEVSFSAAQILCERPLFPESAIQSLIAALQDDYDWVKAIAAIALWEKYTLPTSVIRSLIEALKDSDEDTRNEVSHALHCHYHSLFTSLPHLTEEEIACVYENHLFQSSCRHDLYLQMQDGKLCLHTENGILHLETAGNDLEEKIISAFRSVQQKAGIKA